MKRQLIYVLFLIVLSFSVHAQQLLKRANVKVTNSLQYTGGTPGANKVLVSDANGNATWGAITDSSDIWQSSAGNISLTDSTDNVGIGISNPTHFKLRVEGDAGITGGNALRVFDASGADSLVLIDDGDTSFISSVNIIKIGDYVYLNGTGVGIGKEAADSLLDVDGGIKSAGGRFTGDLLPNDSAMYSLGNYQLWWDTIYVNEIRTSGGTIILDNDVELSVPSANKLRISDTTSVQALVVDSSGIQSKSHIVPIDSGVVNLGSASLHYSTSYANYWVGHDAPIKYYAGLIDSTDVNAEAAASSITLNLPIASAPSGYAVSSVYIEVDEEFASVTRGIETVSVQSNSPNEVLRAFGGITFSTGLVLRGSTAQVQGNDYVVGGIDLVITFGGGGDNPQNYTAGRYYIFIVLERIPSAP